MNNQEKRDLWNTVLARQSRGYSEKEVVKRLKYLGYASSMEERPPFITLGEIKNYGVKFSTLYENLGEV